jgi:hypothetical protein
MPNAENIEGKGFDNHPENINRTGANRGYKTIRQMLKKLVEIEGDLLLHNIKEMEVIIDEHGKEKYVPTGNIIKHGSVKVGKLETILMKAMNDAAKGNAKAREYVSDRLEGKAQQNINMNVETPKIKGITFDE